MLTSLTIRNYALIEELTVEFERGLNIITGETGAGKSIIIGALGLILGERADADAVRKGAEKSIVEGVFGASDDRELRRILAETDIEWSDELIVRREVSVKGTGRAFINDSPVTGAALKRIGERLVDLHGQHEHQSLLRVETHGQLLDDAGGLETLVAEFGACYKDVRGLCEHLRDLRAREQQIMERRSLHEFQINEIDAVGPHAGEEEELQAELTILENAERLFSATERLYQMLYEGEKAIHDQLVLARNELESLTAIDKVFEEQQREASSAAAIVAELAKFIQQYNAKIEFNPERLEEIRDRLGHLTMLKKKYGGSLEAVVQHRERIGGELKLASNFGQEIGSLEQQIDARRRESSTIAQRLSSKRQETARKISKAVVASLRDLGIANAVFEVVMSTRPAPDPATACVKIGREFLDATPRGIDIVEFHVSTNSGEDPKPLVKVASGGEISRIMLALKMILAKADRLPLLVFDEIDVGISGRIAQAVGENMRKLSQFHQVIAITHLPQIAGLAENHFVVEKRHEKNRSVTTMRKLSVEDRVREVAKLLSGTEVTGAALKSARELMEVRSKA